MVEIFKGKDSDGVWREGFYCVFNDEAHRIYTGYAETDCGEYYPDYYTVIPQLSIRTFRFLFRTYK